MSGETNGTNEGGGVRGDGIMLEISEASATKGCREVKDGEVEGGKGSGKGGKVLIEGLVEDGKLGDEGGVPRVERWEVVDVGMMEDIGSKII